MAWQAREGRLQAAYDRIELLEDIIGLGVVDSEVLGRLKLMAPLVQSGVLQARGKEAPQPVALQRARRNVAAHSFKVSVQEILKAGRSELNRMQRGKGQGQSRSVKPMPVSVRVRECKELECSLAAARQPEEATCRAKLASLLKAAPWRRRKEFIVVETRETFDRYIVVEVPAVTAPGRWEPLPPCSVVDAAVQTAPGVWQRPGASEARCADGGPTREHGVDDEGTAGRSLLEESHGSGHGQHRREEHGLAQVGQHQREGRVDTQAGVGQTRPASGIMVEMVDQPAEVEAEFEPLTKLIPVADSRIQRITVLPSSPSSDGGFRVVYDESKGWVALLEDGPLVRQLVDVCISHDEAGNIDMLRSLCKQWIDMEIDRMVDECKSLS